jgi:hypothetical protein
MRLSLARRWLGIVVAPLCVMFAAADAQAFCRSTTCRSTAEKECPKDEDGCVTSGKKLIWNTSCLGFAIQEDGTRLLDLEGQAVPALKAAFGAWSGVACPSGKPATLNFTAPKDYIACKKSQYNPQGKNVNVVFFQDDTWNYRGLDATLAKTSVTYNDDTGEIYDADIEVNAAKNVLTTSTDPSKAQYDLQAIMTHEVGHFIGIAHSANSSAVMFASYSPGSLTQRTLTDDDIDAVCAIYPPTRAVECNAEPKGGYSAQCDDTSGSSSGGSSSGGVCALGQSAPDGLLHGGLVVLGLAATLGRRRRSRKT